MKNPPCARFGTRIRPKISEKPDDSRNSRPPKATLFSVWMIQNCHCMISPLATLDVDCAATCRGVYPPLEGPGRGGWEQVAMLCPKFIVQRLGAINKRIA